MDKEQEDKLGMFKKVQTFLVNNAVPLSATPVIGSQLQPDFDNLLAALLQEAEDASAPISGSTVAKAEKRLAVEELGFQVAGAVTSYYTLTVPDPVLRAKCDYVRSALTRMRDSDLYVNISRVHEIANPIKLLLGPFGVSDTVVDNLATALSDYFEVLQAPKDALGARSASNKQLVRMIAGIDELLKEKLDVVMRYYVSANPELHDYYLSARSIDQSGGGAQPDVDVSGTIDPGLYFTAPDGFVFSSNTRIVLSNTGAPGSTDVVVGFGAAPDSFSGTTQTVAPGNTIDVRANEVGFSPASTYFVLFNSASPTAVPAAYSLKVYF